jgi:hypothetical protein
MYETLLVASVCLRVAVYGTIIVLFARAKDYAPILLISLLILGSLINFMPLSYQPVLRLIDGDLLAPALVLAVLMGKGNRL